MTWAEQLAAEQGFRFAQDIWWVTWVWTEGTAVARAFQDVLKEQVD